MSIFETLNKINVNDKTEKKNGLTYLSWAWAWGEVKKAFPDAVFTIYERETPFGPVNYFTDGRTCWVKTGLTIDGLEHIEELPVMDFKNRAIPLDNVTSTDVNKAIQRSLTKAAARHGLGLYIYAGEDLPEEEAEAQREANKKGKKQEQKQEISLPPATSTVTTMNQMPVPKTTKQYINEEIAKMQNVFNIPDKKQMISKFAEMKKILIEGKVIPDVKTEDQTMEQAEQMVKAIYDNFLPDGAVA